MTHDEMIAVIQAHKEGKQIEAIVKKTGLVIHAVPIWDFCNYDYRIKPEPRPDVVQTFWCTTDNKGYWHLPSGSLPANLRLTFDGETGKLKKAEVI